MADGDAQAGRGQGRARRLTWFVRTRRGGVVVGAVVVLVAAGLGTWATGSGPFGREDRYCWGAWEANSGPGFLSDTVFEGDDQGARTSEETAPTPRRPAGRCEVALRSSYTGGDGGKTSWNTRITLTYGPAPKDAAERMEWIGAYLGDRAVPLPDGLPGASDGRRGLLVLPERCDTRDGRPAAVTLDSDARTTWGEGGSMRAKAGLGGIRSVAGLLVSAANRGMEAAGCAPAKPLRVSSPVLLLPEEETGLFSGACRIKGLEFDEVTRKSLAYQVGAVTRDLQSCAVRVEQGDSRYFDALMVAQPRLAALFDGTTGSGAPADGWRGSGVFADDYKVVRADCAGRPVTLLMVDDLTEETTPYFTAFTDAVTARLGCPPVAPVASGGSER
ncbi:hypothetical protein ACFV0Y_35750 [Streptomyces sp. NPDC059569]|uniref:hypothetical protein n=1 Tax=Streptomyces sp. NPDC059569 TaxID=3346869 RepID=UPI0036B4E765